MTKHSHGQVNPIMLSEQAALIVAVDRALASSSNAQTIGRNGEIPLRSFLNRHLPYTLKAHTGHFVTPAGNLSPQTDVMIVDSRYPLLAENADASVLVMLHSVVRTIEVKTRIASSDVKTCWKNAVIVSDLCREIKGYGLDGSFSAVMQTVLAYRSRDKTSRIGDVYESVVDAKKAWLDIHMLVVPDEEQVPGHTLGLELHMEPTEADFICVSRLCETMLSDVYYQVIQDSYYCLSERNWSFEDIGRHFMEYMSWSTYGVT